MCFHVHRICRVPGTEQATQTPLKFGSWIYATFADLAEHNKSYSKKLFYGRFYAVLHIETRYIEVPWASQSLREKTGLTGEKMGWWEGFLSPRGGTGSCQERRYQRAGQPGSAPGKQVHEVPRPG